MVHHAEVTLEFLFSPETKFIANKIITIFGEGMNKVHNPNSCLSEWRIWLTASVQLEYRFEEVRGNKGYNKIVVSGTTPESEHRVPGMRPLYNLNIY